ncbi:MAG: NPCBM/NEW2 domain-containing protein [Gemmataceae bacterium]
MRLARFSLAGAFLLMPLLLTRAGEVALLKGDPIKGDILSVNNAEVVLSVAGEKKTVPLANILKIDFQPVAVINPSTKYSRAELTDGTVLLASAWKIRKRDLTLKLLSGPEVTIPLQAVANLLNQAEDEKNRADWKSRTFNNRGREAIVIKKGDVISNIECTLGEGDAEGKTITLAVIIDGEPSTLKRTQTTAHGFLFKTVLDPKAPPVLCKLIDTLGNIVMVAELQPQEGGLKVITPAGASLEFRYTQIARLDYAKGKLDYLSSLTPSKIVAKSNLDEDTKPDQWHIYKDTNLNKGPLTLGGVTYSSGLALKPYAELTYELDGEYREFSALVGLDDNVSAVGKTILVVEGDGRELVTVEISADDKKRFRPVTLNIKDVQKLKIIVKADGEFDVARHLDLADAKVSK